MNSKFELRGDHGRICLQPNGGMIGPAEFFLPGLDPIYPLTCPDWSDRKGAQDWLPLIANLCGDFVCAPYGAPQMSDALPENWRRGANSGISQDQWFHGYPVNFKWKLIRDKSDPSRASMVCLPPKPHPFSKISREVSLLPDEPGYEVELTIVARTDVKFPLALHPCFSMPDEPGAMRLEISNTGRGWTYPLAVVPEHAPISVDARFDNLNAVLLTNNELVDITHLPPDHRCEALLQIPAPDGEARLVYDKAGYGIKFNYDSKLLPCLVIWISNCGRDEAPFDGSFRTLGIEAVAGAFDLGPAVSTSPDNPIAREGISTYINLSAGEKLITTSTIRLEKL